MAVDNSGSTVTPPTATGSPLVDMTLANLLDHLTLERYDNRWWNTPASTTEPDNDITCARRRREMAADFAAMEHREREAR